MVTGRLLHAAGQRSSQSTLPSSPQRSQALTDGEVTVGKGGLGKGWSSQICSAVGTGGEEASCVAERPGGPGPTAAPGVWSLRAGRRHIRLQEGEERVQGLRVGQAGRQAHLWDWRSPASTPITPFNTGPACGPGALIPQQDGGGEASQANLPAPPWSH